MKVNKNYNNENIVLNNLSFTPDHNKALNGISESFIKSNASHVNKDVNFVNHVDSTCCVSFMSENNKNDNSNNNKYKKNQKKIQIHDNNNISLNVYHISDESNKKLDIGEILNDEKANIHSLSNRRNIDVSYHQVDEESSQESKINFTKKENLNKLIFNNFKKFLKKNLHKNLSRIFNNIINYKFWNRFIAGEFNPPFCTVCHEYEKVLSFKSINSSYIDWIFSSPYANEFYCFFLKEESQAVFRKLRKHFNIEDFQDQEILKEYLLHFSNRDVRASFK